MPYKHFYDMARELRGKRINVYLEHDNACIGHRVSDIETWNIQVVYILGHAQPWDSGSVFQVQEII